MIFQRQDEDLFCEVPLPAEIAALGGEIEVPTTEGYARLKIEPGTESGRVFRLRGKGMPSLEDHGKGDLHIRIVVEVATRLNSSVLPEAERCTGLRRDRSEPARRPRRVSNPKHETLNPKQYRMTKFRNSKRAIEKQIGCGHFFSLDFVFV